ncbi:MAG: hypothetical protein K2K46_11025, partial [Lachnospiraceae bacterium]|nr:hypothetical protein [Lachnospiraceae bacterium]
MSKIASKLSRQIMAAVLSVAMILPNMTVYASEVSVPDTQEEITVDNGELNEEQPSLTEEEPKLDEGGEETLPEDDEADEVSNDGGEDSDDGGQSEEPEKSEESDVSEPSNAVSEDSEPLLDETPAGSDVVEIPTTWEFKDSNSANIVTDLSTCKGLTVNGATLQSGNSLNFSGSNEINIAVGKPCDIKVDYWHTADATIGVGEDTKEMKIETQGGTGSTTYKYRGDGEATVTIKGGSVRTYISTITITAAPTLVTIPATWEFKDSNSANIVTDLSTCKGLTVNGATLQSGNSLNFSGSNEINIAVGKPCDIKVDYWHTADATIGVGEDTKEMKIETQGGTGSTTYKYRGDEEAIVTIKGGSVRTYISTITITAAPTLVTIPTTWEFKDSNSANIVTDLSTCKGLTVNGATLQSGNSLN